MPADLLDLVDRCRRGSEPAIVELVNQFSSRVFSLCFRMLRQRQDAEDAAQETFVRAIRHLDQWDPDRDFEPWLFTIAANRCRSAIAKRERIPLTNHLPERGERDGLQGAAHLSEEIDLALAGLREELRQAFVLFHEHGLSYAEIAVALQCPPGTVKTWVHRARRELVRRLTGRGILQESRNAVRSI